MSEKHIYNAIVTGECDQHEFIHTGHACDYECIDECSMFPELMVFKLTEEEAAELSQCEEIISLNKEESVHQCSTYPDIFREQNSNFITNTGINLSGQDGSSFATTSFYYFSDSIENPNPVGNFIDPPENENNYIGGQSYDYWNDGKYVDIVAVEAGQPDISLSGTVTHPDFLSHTGTQRFVPMNWSNYNASVDASQNNQATDGIYFDPHAIGVLSTSGGLISGWCKNSSLRVIYLNYDPVVSVYGAILAWHNSKSINPDTGKRNATVVTGAWGYNNSSINYAVEPDVIDQIQWYDEAGNLTVTNRPGSSWNNNFTPFIDANIVPRYINDGGVASWMIPWTTQDKISEWEVLGNAWSTTEGIYNFMSAGNSAAVKAGWYQPQWNTSVRLEDPGGGTVSVKSISQSFNGFFNISNSTISTSNLIYPLRNGRDGDTRWCITVGATQHSDTNPLLDGYSERGPVIDISANGTRTYNAYPQVSDGNGFFWGFFGGTSNAAPQTAGIAGVIISWWYTKYGRFPTLSELKTFMLEEAKPVLQSDRTLNYSNLTGAPISSEKLYAVNKPNEYNETEFFNTGFELTELFGTTNKRVFLPYKVRMDRIAQYHNDVHGKLYVDRPATGQTYPRRRIRLTSS